MKFFSKKTVLFILLGIAPKAFSQQIPLEINRFTPYGVEIKKEVYKGKDLRGSIGLWLDISTVAHFADIEITKID